MIFQNLGCKYIKDKPGASYNARKWGSAKKKSLMGYIKGTQKVIKRAPNGQRWNYSATK